MRRSTRVTVRGTILAAAHALLAAPVVQAAAGGGGWRPVYDTVMMWINFLILAAVLVKFGRPPLMRFLRGRSRQWQQDIEALEQRRDAAHARIQDAEAQLAARDAAFDRLRERIVQQGQRERQQLVDEARRQSATMLEEARRRVAHHIRQAHQTLRDELVDLAMDTATARLPAVLTDDDHERFAGRYVDATRSAASGPAAADD